MLSVTSEEMRTILKKANKNSEITEDELKDQQDKVQKATDKYIKTIDGMIDKKSKEILTV